MDKPTPLSDRIRAMLPLDEITIKNHSVVSVRATVTRVRTEFPRRYFHTRVIKGGSIQVWRLA